MKKPEFIKQLVTSLLKKTNLLLVFFACCSCFSNAQNKEALPPLPTAYYSLNSDTARMNFLMHVISDSLDEGQLKPVMSWSRLGLQMAEKNSNDTMRGIFYFDIAKAFVYAYNKYDSAIAYYKKVIPYFPDKLRKYNVISVREIMERYADLGNKDSSFVYLDMLNALTDTMSDSNPRKIGLSQNIATVYQYFGMYRTAIHYFQVSINGNRANKNFKSLGIALANLGELYNQMDDIPKGIVVAKEALENLVGINMPYMQTAGNIADYYVTLGQYDSAKVYLDITDAVAEKTGNEESKLINQSIRSRIYIATKDFTTARIVLDKAIAGLRETDDNWTLCRALTNYADLDTSLHQYENAKKHLTTVLDIARKNEFVPVVVQTLEKLAKVYSLTGDYKSAHQYQLQYTVLRDSISSSKSKADLNDLEISYKTLQKEQEIALLKKDNDIKNLQIRNAERMKIFYISFLAFLALLFIVIYYQRNKRSKIKAQKIRAELEMQILRSQMNPHFIFNSLNSIENFIMQNEKRLASDYLNKFSRLIRSILDSSRDEVVPVIKDMEVLRLYTDLEQLRFNNKFSCHIYTDPQLVSGDYVVPSLLIQPYVENAIVHGIAHSHKEKLELTVTAVLEGDHIKYTIQDNGVGRSKAGEYNRQNKPGHRSVGLQITANRIAHFNHEEPEKAAIKVIDLYNEYNKPTGTKVELSLKAV